MSIRASTLRMTPSEIAISAIASPRPRKRAFRMRMSATPDVTARSRSLLRSYDKRNRIDQIAAFHTLLSNPSPGMPATTARELRFSFMPDMTSHSHGALRPSFSFHFRPRKSEGAGKTGCALHPRSRVQTCTKKSTRAYRFSGNTPAFPAQWFYGLCRALPGDRLSCHRRHADRSAQLDASIGASGPHDFAVRVSAVRQWHLRVHRLPPRGS